MNTIQYYYGIIWNVCVFQVIVQGLKEVGVFNNALASELVVLEKSISKENFLSSMFNMSINNSSVAQTVENKDGDKHQAKLMQKVGEGETQAASRNLLEASVHIVVAVPPLEPPSLDVYTGSF